MLDRTPLRCDENTDYCASADPAVTEIDAVATRLIAGIATGHPGQTYLLHIEGPSSDPVIAKLPPAVKLIRATASDFDYAMRDNVMGFDGHPGPYWHYAIYRRIRETILPNDLSGGGG